MSQDFDSRFGENNVPKNGVKTHWSLEPRLPRGLPRRMEKTEARTLFIVNLEAITIRNKKSSESQCANANLKRQRLKSS